jgi:hypothetical protein
MVAFTIIVFVVFFSIPIFAFLLDMTWLPYLSDFLLVTLCALAWATTVSVIWRSGLVDPIARLFAHTRWPRGKKASNPEDFNNPATSQYH